MPFLSIIFVVATTTATIIIAAAALLKTRSGTRSGKETYANDAGSTTCSEIVARPFDTGVEYTGYYGQGVVFQLSGYDSGGSYVVFDPSSGTFVFDAEQPSPPLMTMELARANPKAKNREPGRVYLGDVFHILHRGRYATIDKGRGRVTLAGNSPKAEFVLSQKYGTGCDFDGKEYDATDANNRNTACAFPYVDCVRRCGKRKISIHVGGGKFSVLGTRKSCGTYGGDGGGACPWVWEGVSGWRDLEMNIRGTSSP